MKMYYTHLQLMYDTNLSSIAARPLGEHMLDSITSVMKEDLGMSIPGVVEMVICLKEMT